MLNNRITNIDDIKKYIAYGKENNIDFLPPDINKSGVSFTVENGKITFRACRNQKYRLRQHGKNR